MKACVSWRILKESTELGTRGPKEGAAGDVGQRQRENRPMRKERWTPTKLEEELPAPARLRAKFSQEDHLRHNTASGKEMVTQG